MIIIIQISIVYMFPTQLCYFLRSHNQYWCTCCISAWVRIYLKNIWLEPYGNLFNISIIGGTTLKDCVPQLYLVVSMWAKIFPALDEFKRFTPKRYLTCVRYMIPINNSDLTVNFYWNNFNVPLFILCFLVIVICCNLLMHEQNIKFIFCYYRN